MKFKYVDRKCTSFGIIALNSTLLHRCHGKMGTPQNGDPGSPYSWEYGDPGSPYSREYGDPGSHFPGKMGTPGPHFPREYGDPLSENGDPLYDRWLTVGKWGSNIIRLEFRPMQGLVNH